MPYNFVIQQFASEIITLRNATRSQFSRKEGHVARYALTELPGRYSRRITSQRDDTTCSPLPPFLSFSLARSLPSCPPFSPTLRALALPPVSDSVRILVQYEGMGTLHGPNSQPRRDLALCTYLHKPRAVASVCVRERVYVCVCVCRSKPRAFARACA